jgi:ABC-type Fe3+-hydroxamate transport system substrate-binding protein
MRIASLRAVREGSIHFLTDDYLLIPGVRVAQTVKKLARIIHPEVFHEQID